MAAFFEPRRNATQAALAFAAAVGEAAHETLKEIEMPILTPIDVVAEIVFLGVTPDRSVGLESAPLETVAVDYGGFVGDAHAGLTRPSCSRVKLQYPRGTEIKNARQISIVSEEEMAAVGADMGLPGPVGPDLIGANLSLRGVPELTTLPPGSRIIFDGGVSLAVDMENGPCKFAGEAVDAAHPGLGLSFPKHAAGRRGVTAWVERTGVLRIGETARVHCPPQRIYRPAVRRADAAE